MNLGPNVVYIALDKDSFQKDYMHFTVFIMIYYVSNSLPDICLEYKPPVFRVNA